ncbi:MAG: LacI family DNA-binding transcriptional regulator [Oscillospiraceae bacterium]
MQERVRICDIAEELGLSTATVSNVIHGKTNKVSDETVQRVTALLEKRRYIPSMAGILPGPQRLRDHRRVRQRPSEVRGAHAARRLSRVRAAAAVRL